MNTTKSASRTRRGEGFASIGAVAQRNGSLPIYICNRCGREVVWATSQRTGRKYLCNVSHGFNGARYYIGKNVHTDEVCQERIDRYAAEEQRLAGELAIKRLVSEAITARKAGDDATFERLLDEAAAIKTAIS